MKIFLVYLVFLNSVFAQDFCDIKFSINDIQYQRNLLSANKIKKITVNTSYSREEFSVSEDGKIIYKNIFYDAAPHEYQYLYEGSNLIEIRDLQNSVSANNYFYDAKGNVEKSLWSGVIDSYSYDKDNKLLNTVVIESVDACDYPLVGDSKTILYKDGEISEIKWNNCYDDTYGLTRLLYDDEGRLSKILQLTVNCSNNFETINSTSQYIYSGKYNCRIRYVMNIWKAIMLLISNMNITSNRFFPHIKFIAAIYT